MRRVVGIILLFIITVPPLIYFYIHSQDKDLAGILLAVFAGFFVDRCIDALDRQELSIKVKEITEKIDKTLGRMTVDGGVAVLWRVPLATTFAYAASRLKGAGKMLNTALATRRHGGTTSKGYEDWIAAIAHAVIRDGCLVQEVVAAPARARAVKDILDRHRKHTGSYWVRNISTLFEANPQLPFTEFVVFDYRNGNREVMFGWSTSSESPANQDCFATADPAVVAFFEAQFHRLGQLGHDTEDT
jgi:hypothetical protein